MKTLYAVPAMAALALLAACNKPGEPAADATAASGNAMSTTANAAAPGGVISPLEANGAVNTDANKDQADVAAASNSFTEGQAKGHIENAGYSEVTGLMKTPDGMWTAKAMKGGKSVDVAVDFKGAVTAK